VLFIYLVGHRQVCDSCSVLYISFTLCYTNIIKAMVEGGGPFYTGYQDSVVVSHLGAFLMLGLECNLIFS